MTDTTPTHRHRKRLAGSLPAVELLACERVAAERLRLDDRPPGRGDAGAVRATSRRSCTDLLAEYSLEVSSPGPERPLTKPDHFRRFLGRRARVRTREPRDGHKSFTGELVGATEDEVTVAADRGGAGVDSRTQRSAAATCWSERRGQA